MLKTAECVSPAHPDKLCDQISDLILDECLLQDPTSRVAVEVCGGHGQIFITGEITSNSKVDYAACAKRVLEDNRYNSEDFKIIENVSKQSKNIADGVDTGGAGDQGIMVGYATRETSNLIPFELNEAREILKTLWDTYSETRDAKAQVTTEWGVVKSVVVSAERLKEDEIKSVLEDRYGSYGDVQFFINPAGEWDNGGFESDAGLTGRKLAVDNYGPQVEIGGGAFSGKDCTKVDRSAAYMARKIAVDILNADFTIQWVKVKLAYSIGVAEPVMLSVETNLGDISVNYTKETYTPAYIKDILGLTMPQFYQTAKWGHFGNSFVWDI